MCAALPGSHTTVTAWPTVFGPTDVAFADLLTRMGLTQPQLLADTALLTVVLRCHVVDGLVLKADVPVGVATVTLEPGMSFSVDAALVIIDGQGRQAQIVSTDVFAANGVIHVLDAALLP